MMCSQSFHLQRCLPMLLRVHQLVIGHGQLLPLVEDTLEDLADEAAAAFLSDRAGEDHVHASFLPCPSQHLSINILRATKLFIGCHLDVV